MLGLILGILLGWFIPRPRIIGQIEEKLLGNLKEKIPERFHWW